MFLSPFSAVTCVYRAVTILDIFYFRYNANISALNTSPYRPINPISARYKWYILLELGAASSDITESAFYQEIFRYNLTFIFWLISDGYASSVSDWDGSTCQDLSFLLYIQCATDERTLPRFALAASVVLPCSGTTWSAPTKVRSKAESLTTLAHREITEWAWK